MPVMAAPYPYGGAAVAAPMRAIVKVAPAVAGVPRSQPVMAATASVTVMGNGMAAAAAVSPSHAMMAATVDGPMAAVGTYDKLAGRQKMGADAEMQQMKVERDARRVTPNGQLSAAQSTTAIATATAVNNSAAIPPPTPARVTPLPISVYKHLFNHSTTSSFTPHTTKPHTPHSTHTPRTTTTTTTTRPTQQPLYPNSSVGPDGPSRSLACRHMFIPYHIFYDVRRQLLAVLGVGVEDEHCFLNPQMGEGEVRQRWGEMRERRRREGEEKEREAKRVAEEEQQRQQQAALQQQMLAAAAPHGVYAAAGVPTQAAPQSVAYYDPAAVQAQCCSWAISAWKTLHSMQTCCQGRIQRSAAAHAGAEGIPICGQACKGDYLLPVQPHKIYQTLSGSP